MAGSSSDPTRSPASSFTVPLDEEALDAEAQAIISDSIWAQGRVTNYASTVEHVDFLEGYITVVQPDGRVSAQVWGPWTPQWLALEYDYDREKPVTQWIVGNWYVVEREDDNQIYNERGRLTSGPFFTPDGSLGVKLYFSDNGHESVTPVKSVFEIKNYDEVDLIPPQATSFYVIGVSNRDASPEQLQALEDQWRKERVYMAVIGERVHLRPRTKTVIVCKPNGRPMKLS